MTKCRHKKRTIVFEELNFFNLGVALFFALLRFKVYYLYQTERFRSDTAFCFFKALGIELINFEECHNIDISITDADSKMLTHRLINEFIKDEQTFSFWGGMFPGLKDFEKKMESVIHQMAVANFMRLSNVLCWIEDYAEPGEKIFLFSPNNIFRKIILKNSNLNCVNLYPVMLFYSVAFYDWASRLAGRA